MTAPASRDASSYFARCHADYGLVFRLTYSSALKRNRWSMTAR
jgi:hypothetical protein